MGGTIGAESEPGRGSTFWFELELATAPGRGRPRRRRARCEQSRRQLGPRPPLVLVAEDSPVNQIVAVRTLERCGYRADVVGDGARRSSALARSRYDAV